MPFDGRFDAVVIGGGPAGSIAALQLNRLGWRTALIEKRPRGAGKTCGHCLHRRGVRRLHALGLGDAIRNAQVGVSTQLRVHVPRINGRKPAVLVQRLEQLDDDGPPSVLVRRDRFDQALTDHAAAEGVTVFQPAAARLHDESIGQITVRTDDSTRDLQCGLIVGADGLRSVVATRLNTNAERHGKYGFSFDYDDNGRAGELGDGAVDMFITSRGYLGIVRETDGPLHVAALVQPHSVRDLFGFVRDTADRFDALRDVGLDRLDRDHMHDLRGAGPIPWRAQRFSAVGVALVGDAAEFIEPFTGEGMCWAIESACVLGDVACDQPVGRWDERAATQYAQQHRDRIQSRKKVCRATAAVLQRPALHRPMVRLGNITPGVGAVMRNVVGQ